MKKRPGRRLCLGKAARRVFRRRGRGKSVGRRCRPAPVANRTGGQRPRPGRCGRYRPSAPSAGSAPDCRPPISHTKRSCGKRRAQGLQRVGREIRAAEAVFDIAHADPRVTGRDPPRLRQPFDERRHAGDRLQRVLRRDHPPDLVEAEAAQRQLAEMQVTLMSRVERAAQQPDAAMPAEVRAPGIGEALRGAPDRCRAPGICRSSAARRRPARAAAAAVSKCRSRRPCRTRRHRQTGSRR